MDMSFFERRPFFRGSAQGSARRHFQKLNGDDEAPTRFAWKVISAIFPDRPVLMRQSGFEIFRPLSS